MGGAAKANGMVEKARTAVLRYGLALLSVAAAFGLAHAFLYFHLPQPFTAFALSAIAITFWYAGIAAGIVAVLLSLLIRTFFFEPEIAALSRAVYALVFVTFAVLMSRLVRGRHDLEARVAERTSELTNANVELQEKIRQLAVTSDTLHQAEADLARVNRVTTMGALTAALAHEVNQPIAAAVTSASASLRWLARVPPNLEEAREALRQIVADGTRAAEIVSRARLMFSKAVPRRESVDVNAVIRETVALLDSEASRHHVRLRTELANDLPRVCGDRVQLQQVMMNLMVNGIDAMNGVDAKREVAIRSQRAEKDGVLVSVLDTGIGLPAEKAAQIFEAFFTTKPHGVGMGLAVCRSIIESHGGRLWAGDNSPRGAAFFLSLPADDAGGGS
jgi:C4-dicarboxylate-specific signal transduction histidine kinase